MLSVIIPIGGEDEKGRKRRNLDEMILCIEEQNYKDYEVIIVEEVYKNKLYDDIKADKYIHVYNKGGYRNISWTRNIGSNISEGEKLLHLDADLVFDKNYFKKIIDFKEKGFAAWDTCFRLNEKGFKDYITIGLEKINKENIDPREGLIIVPRVNFTAGFANCFDREFFFKEFGGYNENYFGWGGEDNDATLRFSTLLGKYHILPNCTIYHLPHGGRKTRKGNYKELQRTIKNPLEITNLLLKTKLGNIEGPKVV